MKTKVEMPLNEKAILLLERTIDQWRAEPGDKVDLRKCYAKDRKDLRHVLSLYKKGQWAKAGEFSSHLDTMVREMIPDPIWEAIQTAYTGYEE
jgi:hypothetical protein